MQAFRAASCRKWRWTACLLIGLFACEAEPPAPVEPELGLAFIPVETRTSEPDAQTIAHMELTGLAFLPKQQGLLVWEKNGRVLHYRRDSDDVLTRLGEFKIRDVEQESDCGLISIALDPAWEQNHYLYAGHCVNRRSSEVTRYRFDPAGGDYEAVADSAQRVIEFGDRRANRAWHNVGALGFFDDPEHSMWILTGDKRRSDNAQDHSTNLGGVLRIIPNRGAEGGYEPHPDNPFGGPGSDPELQSSPELYAWGLRSPWRGAIDARGRIFIGDVGEGHEEINVASTAGQNFGWEDSDGPCDPEEESCEGLTDPVAWWGRSSDHRYVHEDGAARGSSSRVAWVGAPYRPHPQDPYRGVLDDSVLFSDMCIGFVRALSVDDQGEVTRDDQLGHLVGLSGAAQADDGQLYVTSYGDCTSDTFGIGGGIFRAAIKEREKPPPEPERPSHLPLVDDPLGPMPTRLSESGLFEDLNERKPNAKGIAYEPTLQLWSNGSAKERFVFLPKGERIDNARREHWEFPAGTLFVKTFHFPQAKNQSPIETRIIRRLEDGWDYQVYRWRDGDGHLLALDRSLPVRLRTPDDELLKHEIPSRFDCKNCHEHNETVIIGFDELRLNSVLEGEVQTQLELLAERDLFTTAIPEEPLRIVGDDPTERAVLGYMHGNCAHCHNASPQAESRLDLTFQAALSNIIGRDTEGSGQAVGVRVVPGAPDESVLFQALSLESEDEDLKPMPPVGVQLIDAEAVELFRGWIEALPTP
jgi:glucose/arabinose dehydrogenase